MTPELAAAVARLAEMQAEAARLAEWFRADGHPADADARVLTDGVGRCSVPMWSGGCPAGFCDEPAYGPPERDKHGRSSYGDFVAGRWVNHYVPGLACPMHGGPSAPVPGGGA